MEYSWGAGEVGGICTIRGLMAREDSRAPEAGRVLEKPNSLASCLAEVDGAGSRSSKDCRVGGSVRGRPGDGLTFPEDAGLTGGFSGLLGGVLKGEMWSSDDALSGRSGRGANVLASG